MLGSTNIPSCFRRRALEASAFVCYDFALSLCVASIRHVCLARASISLPPSNYFQSPTLVVTWTTLVLLPNVVLWTIETAEKLEGSRRSSAPTQPSPRSCWRKTLPRRCWQLRTNRRSDSQCAIQVLRSAERLALPQHLCARPAWSDS